MKRAIMIDAKDNVATALSEIEIEDTVRIVSSSLNTVREIKVIGAIPFGHKLALVPIGEGEKVIKYGEVIGRAVRPIGRGEHVHVQNVVSDRV
jgi:altronate dehydratase small subunit